MFFFVVKMSHASLPKIICQPTKTTTKMCSSNFTTTLSDVLQSDPVKRLFNQPNIVIKTIPVRTDAASASNNAFANRMNNVDSNLNRSKQPELSVIPIQIKQEENTEDDTLLPSKKQGKSEITLVPIKREKKPCGHYEPCENITCEVAVQQYVDREGSSPMLAINIEESEINAPVLKHCTNEMCDALSIDHNRCRRAMIRLNRYDQSEACDICGIALKTRRSRISHKKCTRRNDYRHNETSSSQILKERMREREVQILEASKIRRNDYMDPITGNNLAMEALKNNEELIIIPKSVPLQQQQQHPLPPAITISCASTAQSTQPEINHVYNVFGKILPSIPLVLPQQSIVVGKTQCSNENSATTPIQITLPNTMTKSLITTSTVPLPQNQYVTFTAQTNTQSIQLNNLLLPQSQIVTTPIQPKPLLTSIRVVPITNLITQPSLLHQTQGIPKFCLVPDNTAQPLTITNAQSVQQPALVPKVEIPKDAKSASQEEKKPTMREKRRLKKKKEFKCDYCLKSFSTNWYFKMHVAMHTGEKRFTCRLCNLSFGNRYDMKRHMSHDHESVTPDTCDEQTTDDSEGKVNSLDSEQEARKEDKTNGYVCLPTQDIVKAVKTELCHEV
ncbi:unnamed protein product [Xylocopa violacea]|uniref:C2H2-type domain-containing protein n=2 Tax=Xylocopa violacea TaxID=135666 RepID=A0ABP1NF73_XYLVO